jgi:hypothetical protein
LSYRRPLRPGWPYNLFTMIHGRDRAAVLAQVDRIKDVCGLKDIDSAVLFSGRCFRQRGARYRALGVTDPRESPATRATPSAQTSGAGSAGGDRPTPTWQ